MNGHLDSTLLVESWTPTFIALDRKLCWGIQLSAITPKVMNRSF